MSPSSRLWLNTPVLLHVVSKDEERRLIVFMCLPI